MDSTSADVSIPLHPSVSNGKSVYTPAPCRVPGLKGFGHRPIILYPFLDKYRLTINGHGVLPPDNASQS